jgi:tRNA 2-thiouridine synthesizing protein A
VHVAHPDLGVTERVDARGLLCPLPVLRLRKRLMGLAPGTRVTLLATDRAALIDVPHFCGQSGHLLLGIVETAPGLTEFTVERGPVRNA